MVRCTWDRTDDQAAEQTAHPPAVRAGGRVFQLKSLYSNRRRAGKAGGLWRNCEDSIRHALTHFSAGAYENDAFHYHHKWVLLSVAHAAEVYGNLLLCAFNPKHPERADGHTPSLDGVRKLLENHQHLTRAESLVFQDVFEKVAARRNTLKHMPAPELPVVTDAARASLALLHIVRQRTGLPTKEFFDPDPPVEQDILEHIGWRDHDWWNKVAEQLAVAEHARRT
jgi:hypothetical protein